MHFSEVDISLDEEKNGYVARDQLLYALCYMLDSCQEYQIRHEREVTWEQGPIRALASITLHRDLISTTS